MKTILSIAAVGLAMATTPVAASSLRLDCSMEQTVPARALVCEYTVLERLNARLADLDDQIVGSGRAGRSGVRRWVAARDACRDVDCVDRALEAGLRDARLALVDVESRKPTVVISTAQGVAMRLADRPARPVAPAEESPAPEQTWSVREPSRLEPIFSILTVLFLAGVAVYAAVLRRIA